MFSTRAETKRGGRVVLTNTPHSRADPGIARVTWGGTTPVESKRSIKCIYDICTHIYIWIWIYVYICVYVSSYHKIWRNSKAYYSFIHVCIWLFNRFLIWQASPQQCYRCQISKWHEHLKQHGNMEALFDLMNIVIAYWDCCLVLTSTDGRHRLFGRHWSCWCPGPRFNIKTAFPMYGDSHVKDKTVVRPSYL